MKWYHPFLHFMDTGVLYVERFNMRTETEHAV